jgi:hypothetical protein
MIHPNSERRFISPEKGFGVVATADIPRGTLVWCHCALDIVLTPEKVTSLPAAYHEIINIWSYGDPSGNSVLCWDNARFINHSCSPAMMGVGDDLEVAVRDIFAGEELTCDYAMCNLTDPMPCTCGSPNCRGQVGPDDILAYGEEWTKLRAESMERASEVAQPLRPFLMNPARFGAWISDPTQIPSLATYYHRRAPAGA